MATVYLQLSSKPLGPAMRCIVVLLSALIAAANAQIYKLCTTDEINPNTCNALQRGDSKVKCERVIDSAECAIRLTRGEADFGIFYPEELLLAYQFYPNDIVPIFQLKNRDRLKEEFEYQSVAVVPKSVVPVGHASDFHSLKNEGLCHPGFSEAQWWNDYTLKYFERIVAASDCNHNKTVAENEADQLKSFFGKACRPGEWVDHSSSDKDLKHRYPELCELCDDKIKCTYRNEENHGHMGALDCLTSGRGKVAYVALSHVRKYFNPNETEYQFLCPDGITQSLSVETPCAWIKQPWGVIAARKEIAKELTQQLKEWLAPAYALESWKSTLNSILQDDNAATSLPDDTSLASYLSKGREIDLPHSQSCNTNPIKWCTIGDLETNKCNWVAKAAKALGIEPQISCHKSDSTFQCFRDITNDKSDIMVIDSNYGHLARTVYGLTTVLYSETKNDKNSIVVAVVRENENNPINSLQKLRGRKVCFPEYGGIAWMSFVHVARSNSLISSKSCDYTKEVANYLGGVCAPGIRDNNHTNQTVSRRRENILSTMCSACQSSEVANASCVANDSNPFYKDQGALECLSSHGGDIAFLEISNLNKASIDEKQYRLLCKNGSLASAPGFRFDDTCAWSITIDSEVVGKKRSSNVDILDTVLALLKMNNWLGYRLHTRRPINMYEKFNGTSDLLFKDSTIGLVNASSTMRTVEAYKELFDHVETCTDGAWSVAANAGQIVFFAAVAILLGHY